MPAPYQDEMIRFKRFVSYSPTCWYWMGAKGKGYGRFYYQGKNYMAHRWYYERMVGPIPDGLELDHLCRKRDCVNPNHLQAITHAENLARSLRGGYCPNCFHPLVPREVMT